MRLQDLLNYNPIVIQCHNIPDADAVASAYGVYKYLVSKGKETTMIYAGKEEISKANLKLMCQELEIPIEYVKEQPEILNVKNSLLLTVDCQYGAKNVDRFEAPHVAVIDHHRIETEEAEMSMILPSYGACSTIIWKLLLDEGFNVNEDDKLATALYYGLYMDTKELSEIVYPVDRDAADQLYHNNMQILMFKNSNISLSELETAGLALLRYSYNDDYNFAVAKANECDPNILGIVSDFIIQVDSIEVCVVYSKIAGGYKFSVRSCVRKVDASELSAFLADKIGSGGGHYDKAGGFISEKLYEANYPTLHPEGYFNSKMVEYFDMYDLIYPHNYDMDIPHCCLYSKRKRPVGCVKMTDIMPVGSPINIRTIEGDIDMVVTDELYVMIGIKGEAYSIHGDKFARSYAITNDTYNFKECVLDPVYEPTVRNLTNGEVLPLVQYAKTCVSTGNVKIYARQINRYVKVFTDWDKDKYFVGKPGDYIACRTDDNEDIFIIDFDIFNESYSPFHQTEDKTEHN